ncbi:hypothetical protein AVEN_187846-1 [Araneus ventricosus]|uniref:Uncharacterized protein n=1 Tax=Araneus ventricosus TaxID=182803 RepID=A0A4Y2CU17_ARAVE|nr:hypothetical protein AVEN_187846-1 [Araneus ventricosus]
MGCHARPTRGSILPSMRSRKQTERRQLLMESSLAYPRGKEDIVEFTETAVGCSPNRRKVFGRRGAAFGYNNSRAMCVPASTETPEVPSGQAQLAIDNR